MVLMYSTTLCLYVTLHRICPRDLSEKKRMWQLLSRLLATYERLYNEEQVFLLEVRWGREGGRVGRWSLSTMYMSVLPVFNNWAQAVEHVTFGQLQAAQEVVVKLAKESLDSSNK